MNIHEIKDGQDVFLRLKVTQVQPDFSGNGWIFFDYGKNKKVQFGRGFENQAWVRPDALMPAPSENEYNLTLRELAAFADWYANSETMCRLDPAFYKEKFGEPSTYDMVRLWLINNGKEVKP